MTTAPAAAAPVAPASPGAAPVATTGGSDFTPGQLRVLASDMVVAGHSRQQVDAALAAQGIAPLDAAATAQQDAQAHIDRVMAGRDPAFSRAYVTPSDPGHNDAKAKMAAWRQAVAGTAPAAPQQQQTQPAQAAAAPLELALAHQPSDTPAQRAESLKVANAVITQMGADPEMAQVNIEQLAKSINSRTAVDANGNTVVGRPMNAAELGKFDSLLHRQWGPNHGQMIAAVNVALKAAGSQGAAWIKSSIRSADPMAAAIAFNGLARHGQQLAARGKR